jgi:protein O-GlcNAc transferase
MTEESPLDTGLGHHRAGRLDEARAVYAAVLADDPDNAEAHHLMGVLLLQSSAPADAVGHLDRAVALDGGVAKYHGNRAAALGALGRRDEAVAALERAVALDPADNLHRENLARAFTEAGRSEEAVAAWDAAIAADPGNADAQSQKAHLLYAAGDLSGAIPHYRKAAELAPHDSERHSHLCVALNSSAAHTGPEILAEHKLWNDRHAAPLAGVAPPPANGRDPDRRLRVGYVSPDWRRHPIGYLTLPALRNHDREAFDVTLYCNTARGDDRTRLFENLGHSWKNIAGESDEAVFETVRADGIDILVDLTGHHNGNRLLVFARRAAPVQVSWESYSFSTGLEEMDYYIGDELQTPPALQALFTEEIARLPRPMACLAYPDDAPDVTPPPASRTGVVTFGVNANAASATAAAIEAWSDILAGFPGARILPMGWGAPALAAALERGGIPASAILARDMSAPTATYDAWCEIDVALDPFPISGNLETLEALWMGVPVVAMAGDRRIARRSAGHLAAVGLQELIAETPEDYVRIASSLAAGTVRLAELRAGLRRRVADSPLRDEAGFTRALEAFYRDAWRRWCAG